MNEIELEQKRRKGERTRQLLDDELIKGAFNDIRDNIYRNIASSSFDQSEDREGYYYTLKAVDLVESVFKGYIKSGARALEQLNKPLVVKRVQELGKRF